MSEIRQPHNNFFIKTFSNISNTSDFIKGVLPAEIVRKLDLSSSVIEPAGFVDDSLSSHLSDFVIKMKTKNGKKVVDVYMLFEHKSYADENILWQLLKYQYLMFEEDHKAKRKFRIIIPVVFYHGHGKWNVKGSFFESISVPQYLKKYALNFEYIFYDTKDFQLSQSDSFGRNAFLMSALSLLKEHGRMNTEKFRTLVKYIKNSGLAKNEDSVLILLRYFTMTNEVAQKDVADIIKSELGEEAEDIMPSLGRKIYNEGREEGLQEGIEKGAIAKAVETCRNLLVAGLNIDLISKATDLPVEKVLEIQKSLK